jgi:hypothetical protein
MENGSIFTMGRKGKFEGADWIEYLFKQAKDMSKVVGVGLQWSKVVVTKQFGVVVKHIGEHLVVWLVEGNKFFTNENSHSEVPHLNCQCTIWHQKNHPKDLGLAWWDLDLKAVVYMWRITKNKLVKCFHLYFNLLKRWGLVKMLRIVGVQITFLTRCNNNNKILTITLIRKMDYDGRKKCHKMCTPSYNFVSDIERRWSWTPLSVGLRVQRKKMDSYGFRV